MDVHILIDRINQDAMDNRLFRVAGLAREVWPILKSYKDKLHPAALIAVEHYEDEL